MSMCSLMKSMSVKGYETKTLQYSFSVSNPLDDSQWHIPLVYWLVHMYL
uniref:Uncharacterized protein n=1 Tax=Anguilla anguilla TaxID=7936 RepID=A0A0E9WJF1_ANGAN